MILIFSFNFLQIIDISSYFFCNFAPKTRNNMENNLSLSVRMLCRKQGITMRQLAEKMQIAPESLSRAINL